MVYIYHHTTKDSYETSIRAFTYGPNTAQTN